MTPREILIAAKAKIKDPERWCRRVDAWNDDLRCESAPNLDGATRWSAVGAVAGVSNGEFVSDYFSAQHFLKLAANGMAIRDATYLNDTTDHPTVMKMFDRAIELAGEAE